MSGRWLLFYSFYCTIIWFKRVNQVPLEINQSSATKCMAAIIDCDELLLFMWNHNTWLNTVLMQSYVIQHCFYVFYISYSHVKIYVDHEYDTGIFWFIYQTIVYQLHIWYSSHVDSLLQFADCHICCCNILYPQNPKRI